MSGVKIQILIQMNDEPPTIIGITEPDEWDTAGRDTAGLLRQLATEFDELNGRDLLAGDSSD